jgi:ABC-2 type transport system ATP-binding protein
MICCRELTKRFGAFTAVDRLNLEIPRGAICAFLGANGAGKSTTLKMLTGLLAPSSGEVTIGGIDIAKDPVGVKKRIGVLPENLGLFDDLTIEEHLLLTGRVYGLADRHARSRIEQLLRVLHLEHGRRVFASQSSHGMRKKTAFAMALLPNPEVLFLDEPFEAIDPTTSQTMSRLLEEAASRGITVFLTSHILSAIERIATWITIIRSGKVVWNSPFEDLTGSLEQLYFELAETAVVEELEWLGSARS